MSTMRAQAEPWEADLDALAIKLGITATKRYGVNRIMELPALVTRCAAAEAMEAALRLKVWPGGDTMEERFAFVDSVLEQFK